MELGPANGRSRGHPPRVYPGLSPPALSPGLFGALLGPFHGPCRPGSISLSLPVRCPGRSGAYPPLFPRCSAALLPPFCRPFDALPGAGGSTIAPGLRSREDTELLPRPNKYTVPEAPFSSGRARVGWSKNSINSPIPRA